MEKKTLERKIYASACLADHTGNLDSHTGAEIMSLLQRINKERGQTIIMVTHSPEAAKSSNRVITVSDGLLE